MKKLRRYPQNDKATRPLILKDAEQLGFFPPAARTISSATGQSHYIGRYHQNGAAEKTLGAVYTPPRVAAALTRWAVRSPTDRILDPSCGEGVFLSAARTRLADLGARKPCCVGVDIEPKAAQAAGAICEDFFVWFRAAPKFDVIIGNPPFVRSHLFAEQSRAIAFAEMVRLGMKPSRLMSTWSPFLALCSHLLTEDGRLAFVIPEELLHVGYAEDLRRLLLERFRRVIVCLPSQGVFPKVQQAVVMLLCDNSSEGRAGLLTIDYTDLEAGDFDAVCSATPWSWNSKWTHLFLAPNERHLLNEWWPRLGWSPVCDYGRVEVGVVTGDNEFFILNQKRAAEFDESHLTPIVTGSKDLRGIRFGADDFRQLVDAQRPAFLLSLQAPMERLPRSIRFKQVREPSVPVAAN